MSTLTQLLNSEASAVSLLPCTEGKTAEHVLGVAGLPPTGKSTVCVTTGAWARSPLSLAEAATNMFVATKDLSRQTRVCACRDKKQRLLS